MKVLSYLFAFSVGFLAAFMILPWVDTRLEGNKPKPPLSTLDRFESLKKRTLKIEQAVEDMLRGATDCEFGVPEKPVVR